MNAKDVIAGTVLTIVIGGTAYTINQDDVIQNFANDTGISQQAAEQYVTQVNSSDLVSFNVLGKSHKDKGKEFQNLSAQVDCFNYTYEWVSQPSHAKPVSRS